MVRCRQRGIKMRDLEKEKNKLMEDVLGKKRAYEKEDAKKQLDDSLSEMQAGLEKDYGVKVKPDVKASFMHTEENLKKNIIGQNDALAALTDAFRRPYAMGSAKGNIILITGPEGTGRHTAVRLLTEDLAGKGLFQSNEIRTVELSRYKGISNEQVFLQDIYEACSSRADVICFENAAECFSPFIRMLEELGITGGMVLNKRYVLTKGILVENQNGLVQNAVDSIQAGGKYLIFFSNDGTKSFEEIFTAAFLKKVMDRIRFQPLDNASIKKILSEKADQLKKQCEKQLHLSLSIDETVYEWIFSHYEKNHGVNGLTAVLDMFYRNISDVLLHIENHEGVLKIDQGVPSLSLQGKAYSLIREEKNDLNEIDAELNQIVGLKEVKEYIRNLQAHVLINEKRKQQGLKTAGITMHMIFTGNPGTGKTTIARLLARYMKAVGALSEGQLIEVTRADLVAKYVGQTAPLTLQVIQSALGGVLFIDEAYSLYRGKDDSFGLEAIDTLVKAMEDHRDNLIVILAGYTKEMQDFLDANSGLKSRFPNQIEFPDYTGEELMKIAEIQAEKEGYHIDPAADDPLTEYFTQIQNEKAAEAGNGRLARNVVEKAVLNASKRAMEDPSADLSLLKREDFQI